MNVGRDTRPTAAPGRSGDTGARRYCIVGAGPAGLAQARSFKRAGVPFDVLEKHHDVGGIWDMKNDGTPMYETCRFISSRTLSGFFDYPMPENYPDYPGHEQVLAYLRAFARAYDLYPGITFDTRVTSVERVGDGWRVTSSSGTRRLYAGVVCANGMTWDPYMPSHPGRFAGELRHASSYRGPYELAGRRVLIVGAGNTGCDIACDAAGHARTAFISLRRGYHFIPRYILGMPTDVFAARSPKLPMPVRQPIFRMLLSLLVGRPETAGLPRPDHGILESHPIINSELLNHVRDGMLHPKPDIRGFADGKVRFVDGSEEEIDLVLYATGYNMSFPFMDRTCFRWAGNRLKGYLTVFNADHDNLFTLGFVVTAAGVYEDFDRLAELVTNHVLDQAHNPERAARFRELVRRDDPDLSGGLSYIRTARHATYVEHDAFRRHLEKVRRDMGWPALIPGYFDGARAPLG
ncbi:MAG: flavin-containing monooxygenase [Alphaproteobacteria bacterium]